MADAAYSQLLSPMSVASKGNLFGSCLQETGGTRKQVDITIMQELHS